MKIIHGFKRLLQIKKILNLMHTLVFNSFDLMSLDKIQSNQLPSEVTKVNERPQ